MFRSSCFRSRCDPLSVTVAAYVCLSLAMLGVFHDRNLMGLRPISLDSSSVSHFGFITLHCGILGRRRLVLAAKLGYEPLKFMPDNTIGLPASIDSIVIFVTWGLCVIREDILPAFETG